MDRVAMLLSQKHDKALILVVDDDAMHRDMARNVLEERGFSVEEAVDGEQGLIAAERFQPDLVVLDLMMPQLDGFSVCTRLRRNPKFMQLPILMVTALDDVESIDRAFEVGATDFITKPINWQLFAYHVKYMLRASQVESELRKTKELLELARMSA